MLNLSLFRTQYIHPVTSSLIDFDCYSLPSDRTLAADSYMMAL